MGKMMFSAVNLLPSESLYATSVPGFIPGSALPPTEPLSPFARLYGESDSSKRSRESKLLAHQHPILLWGLTLGVLADFLDMLPPYNAVALWRYPTFTVPDLRFLVWFFTRSLRKQAERNVGDLSTGTYSETGPSKSPEPEPVMLARHRRRRPSHTAMDATSQAVAPLVSEAEPAHMRRNEVGISGMGVGSPKHAVGHLLIGYYERVNIAIAVFLAYRSVVGAGVLLWLYKFWVRRRASKL
jgi:hypothetical protein